ncbi:FHA domain-containing protein [Gammaproteobacteria bacterium]
MIQLTLTFVGRTVGIYPLDRERLTIGRRPNNDLHIDNLAVSGYHAQIYRTDEGYILEDLGSTNGTFVNEAPIQHHLLCPGDVVRIGKHELLYSISTPPPASGDPSIPSMGDTSVRVSAGDASISGLSLASTGHLPPASIRVLNGSRRGTELPLEHLRTRLGRPGKASAVITRTSDGYVVTATECKEAVLVNDLPLTDDNHLLENRDLIEIAGFQVEFFYLN